MNRKDKKNSGRKQVFSDDLDYPTQYVFWDDWSDWRDGMRYDSDDTHIRPERMLGWWRKNTIHQMNSKNYRQLRIRQMRKFKKMIRHR